MGRPKDLLKKQEISFDNHHPATVLEWDDELHFHKKLTVNDPKGRATQVSGKFHVKKNRGIEATFDKGKSHPKIQSVKEREYYEHKIKKEISDIVEKDDGEARNFIDHVMKNLDSLSQGENPQEIENRKQQAFDSIMDALDISPKRKINLRNKNNDLLSLYIEAPDISDDDTWNGLNYLISQYGRRYEYVKIDGLTVYYITYKQARFTMGELTPYSFLKYKRQGFPITKEGVNNVWNNPKRKD